MFFLGITCSALAQSGTARVYLIREGMYEGSAVSCSIFKD